VFPDRPIVDLPIEHPVFHSVYDMREYPQVTGLGSFLEWSNATEYAGYLRYTQDAYRVMINEIVYSLTH
jgi:hypothetical protein